MSSIDSATSAASDTTWTVGGEQLLKAYVEKASCMAWMHNWASSGASQLNTALTLPVIALTSATTMLGTSAVSGHQTSDAAMLAITAMSLFSAIAGGAAKVLKTAERAEEHRAASLAWGRYLRKYRMQLSLPVDQRSVMQDTLEKAKNDYDSHMEAFPFLPAYVVRDFERRHASYKGARPEITSGPAEVTVFGEEPEPVQPAPEDAPAEVSVELA